MRLSSAFLAFVVSAVLIPSVASAAGDDLSRKFADLPWATGTQQLTASKSTYAVPAGARMVTGASAAQADDILNGITDADSEGFVDHLPGRDVLYLEWNDSGYVTTDDFDKVDADAMLGQIRSATDDQNAERKKNGASPIYTDAWIAKPHLDQASKTVHWALALHDADGHHFVNAVALKLGRSGYERFTLVTNASGTDALDARLNGVTSAYRYDSGARYADHHDGDKMAGYGIAALVGSVAGATVLAKTGALAAILIALKKFFIVIVAAGVGIWKRFSGRFKKPAAPAMPQSSPFLNTPPQ